jgi:hypothetical protein
MNQTSHVQRMVDGVRNLHSFLLLNRPRQRDERMYYKMVLYNLLLNLHYSRLSAE